MVSGGGRRVDDAGRRHGAADDEGGLQVGDGQMVVAQRVERRDVGR